MGKENMGNIKKLLFKGKHPELVNGQSYTYEHFAKVAGVGYKCLYSRLYGRNYVTDMDLRPLQSHNTPKEYGDVWSGSTWFDETDTVYSRFEKPVDQISQSWLSRRI
jgi:hypothetical protein